MRRLPFIAPVMAVLSLVAGGCALSTSPEPLVVGAIYPTTGSQAPGGGAEARGVNLAVEWANAHGGVHGRPLSLAVLDTPRAEAVPPAMESLRRRGVSVVIGSHGSPISAVAADVASREGMSFWETGAVGQVGPDAAGSRNFFRLSPMGANLGRAAISFVRDELAAKLAPARPLRYAVAFVDDAYGRAVGEGAAAEASAGGGLVGTFPYDAATTDFGELAGRIGTVAPDVLFV
ncbi:MAG: ABC transporter substrate-binding protein, partial [Actinomycetota bacterium]|nr:ABC transporter substrate-binding protein [Actinomycetota bacterium]